MKAYVTTTGAVFGMLFVVHIWRVIVEGTQRVQPGTKVNVKTEPEPQPQPTTQSSTR